MQPKLHFIAEYTAETTACYRRLDAFFETKRKGLWVYSNGAHLVGCTTKREEVTCEKCNRIMVRDGEM